MGYARSRIELVGIVTAFGAVAAIVLIAALVFVPPIWSSAATTVAQEATTIELRSGDAEATLTLPEGWSWRPAFADTSYATVGSPDGVMTVEFRLLGGTDAESALRAVAPGEIERIDEEPAGSARLLHAPVLDADVLVGALAQGETVLTFVSEPSPAYDAELARLLASIEVAP